MSRTALPGRTPLSRRPVEDLRFGGGARRRRGWPATRLVTALLVVEAQVLVALVALIAARVV
jgi:hypothetical protein